MDDILLCVLPLFHIYCLNSVLLSGLRSGSAIVVVRKFELAKVLGLVERRAPLDAYDLSSVRMVMSGAAPLGKSWDKVMAKLPNAKLGQGYGMTEALVSMCFGIRQGATLITSRVRAAQLLEMPS
ncbi:hypothetical protein HPP92_010269 [Vanilla planifolia]|uniref:4-coumarate--CoA ligase n=1 Tax=Vanilla planifolia TaxID=51239 RepID=A0A835V3A6_VANPL|nr:hypothetical protein HPP92_010269 [Vanilla planifolia]